MKKRPAHIFISHSSKDLPFVEKLAKDLRDVLGGPDSVWYDADNLMGGDIWWSTIVNELNRSTAFLIVCSRDAMKSQWIKDETNIAWKLKNKNRLRIIPLLYSPCTLRYGLDALQDINFLENPYQEAFLKLLEALGVDYVVPHKDLHINVDAPEEPIPPSALEEQVAPENQIVVDDQIPLENQEAVDDVANHIFIDIFIPDEPSVPPIVVQPTPEPDPTPAAHSSKKINSQPPISPDTSTSNPTSTPAPPTADKPASEPESASVAPSPSLDVISHPALPLTPTPAIPPSDPVTPLPATPPQLQTKSGPRIPRRNVLQWVALIGVEVVAATALTIVGVEKFTHPNPTPGRKGISTTVPEQPTPDPTATSSVIPLAQDTFQRANQPGWGTASDGQHTWQGDAKTYTTVFSINSQQGQIETGQIVVDATHQAPTYKAFLGGSYGDATVSLIGSVSQFGNPPYLAAMLRWDEKKDDGYKAVLDGSNLFITKRGVSSLGNHPFSALPNTPYNLKFQAVGTTLQAKAWKKGETEPGWMVTVTDPKPISGLSGIRVQMVANTTIAISSFVISE